MKKFTRVVFIVFIAVFIAACDDAEKHHATTHSAAVGINDETRAGYELAQVYCSQCHSVPNPNVHVAADWKYILPRMMAHMKSRNRGVPSADEQQLILEYLQKNAR